MRAATLIALGVAGCGPLVIPRPPPPEGALGEILLVGDEDRVRAAFASDPALPTTFPRTSVAGVERAEIYFVADHLDARGLVPGRFELGGERAEAVGADAIELGGDATWGNGPLRWTEQLRLPPVDVARCLDFGHCFSNRICGTCDLPPPTPPTPPELPTTSCPPGWTRVADQGFGFCRAFATPPTEACPPGTGRFPGSSTCVGVEAPCPGDGWPADLKGPSIVFVSSSATPGGDGTRARPYARVQDAEIAIGTGDGLVVALDRGTHPVGEAFLSGAAELVGACGETVVEGTLDVTGDFALRHLTLSGHVRSNGALSVEDVAVIAPVGDVTAIRASTGSLVLESVSVSAEHFEGVRTNVGVSIRAHRVYVGPGPEDGIIVQGANSRVTTAYVEGRSGFGIQILLATDPVLRDVAILRNHGSALRVERSGNVDIEGVWIEDQRGDEAISIASGGPVTLADVAIVNSLHGDLVVSTASVTARDLVVVDSGPDDDLEPRAHSGALQTSSATVAVRRALFLRPRKPALFLRTSFFTAEDVTVVEHERGGLQISGGVVSLTRARFEAAVGDRCESIATAAIRASRGDLKLESVVTTSTTSPGLYLERDEDMQAVDVDRSRFQRFEGCGGEAVFVRGNWSTRMASVDLSAEDGTALTVATTAGFDLESSRITNSDIGIRVERPIDPFRLVEGTAFVNTRRPFVTSAAP